MTVEMITYFVSLVKDTQEIRDQQLQRVAHYQALADQMTDEAVGAIAGLRAMQGKLDSEEAEAVLATFLNDVDNPKEVN